MCDWCSIELNKASNFCSRSPSTDPLHRSRVTRADVSKEDTHRYKPQLRGTLKKPFCMGNRVYYCIVNLPATTLKHGKDFLRPFLPVLIALTARLLRVRLICTPLVLRR